MCDIHPSLSGRAPDADPAVAAPPDQPARLGRRTLLAGAAALGVGATGAVVLGQLPAEAAPNSQNGWPVLSSGSSRLNPSFRAGGVTFPGGVRRGNAAVILAYVANRIDSRVENLRQGWCWGYARRRIGSSSTWSNHASATALDINAPNHGQGQSGTFNARQVREIRALLRYCDGVIRWGGDYSGTKDEMHFELNVGPNSPRIAALVRKIRS